MNQERRRRFFINKPLQLRYMLQIILPIFIITTVVSISLYFGIWGSVLDVFSDEQLRNDLLTASRLTDYEQVRHPVAGDNEKLSALSLMSQAQKLSRRQQEVFKKILDETNRDLLPKFLMLLLFIGWGSIYISHKIAGPLYRFAQILDDVGNGNLAARAHLRSGDEARFLADRMNHTLGELDQRIGRLREIMSNTDIDAFEKLQALQQELQYFKTRS